MWQQITHTYLKLYDIKSRTIWCCRLHNKVNEAPIPPSVYDAEMEGMGFAWDIYFLGFYFLSGKWDHWGWDDLQLELSFVNIKPSVQNNVYCINEDDLNFRPHYAFVVIKHVPQFKHKLRWATKLLRTTVDENYDLHV